MRHIKTSTEVVERIAARVGVDPIELETPLYDEIDPDALDALVNHMDGRQDQASVRVEFTYDGYAVTVDTTNGITIEQVMGTAMDESSGECEATSN